jgi:hypothetical protein
MSNFYKTTSQAIHKTCLTVGSAIILSSLIAPQIASASPIESFDINGELRGYLTTNPIFSGAAFTGTFDLDLDSRHTSGIDNTATYDLTSWNILFTANSGESFEFSEGELGDNATMYLQPGYDTIAGFDMLTINFIEDNGSAVDSSLQLSFNTNYDITTTTTLTELLDSDPEMGTFDAFRTGSVRNIQSDSGGLSHLGSAYFADETDETVSPVPEASTLAMLGLGSLMVFGLARRNRKAPRVKAV